MPVTTAISTTATRTDGGSEYTAYIVDATNTDDGRTWQIDKRFSEFVALQALLDETSAGRLGNLNGFPSKTFFGALGGEVVGERKVALASWLNSVIQAGAGSLQAMTDFLGAPTAGAAGFDLAAVVNPAVRPRPPPSPIPSPLPRVAPLLVHAWPLSPRPADLKLGVPKTQRFDSVYEMKEEVGRGGFSVGAVPSPPQPLARCSLRRRPRLADEMSLPLSRRSLPLHAKGFRDRLCVQGGEQVPPRL